jgi:hypothetical protein
MNIAIKKLFLKLHLYVVSFYLYAFLSWEQNVTFNYAYASPSCYLYFFSVLLLKVFPYGWDYVWYLVQYCRKYRVQCACRKFATYFKNFLVDEFQCDLRVTAWHFYFLGNHFFLCNMHRDAVLLFLFSWPFGFAVCCALRYRLRRSLFWPMILVSYMNVW